jgi:hypothetical protein
MAGLMSEEVAEAIPLDLLTRMANCATDVIVTEVQSYINNPQAKESTKAHVSKAFSTALYQYEGKSDEERRKEVRELSQVTFDDIVPDVTLERLISWRDGLSGILIDENATPYTAPKSSRVFESVFADIQALVHSQNNIALSRFLKVLTRSKKYFRDLPRKGYTGTIYKPVLVDRLKFETIVNGCDWLINKKLANKAPASWRFL